MAPAELKDLRLNGERIGQVETDRLEPATAVVVSVDGQQGVPGLDLGCLDAYECLVSTGGPA